MKCALNKLINLQYPDVGHCFDIPGKPIEEDDFILKYNEYKFKLGGKAENTMKAEHDSWEYLMKFLEEYNAN